MSHQRELGRAQSLWRCLGVYALALLAAALTARALRPFGVLVSAGVADLVATLIVYLFGRVMKNSSLYDPFWSLAPPILALFWIATASPILTNGVTVWGSITTAGTLRALIVVCLVLWWGARLTGNWIRRWRGLADEDWRYVRLKTRAGSAAWLVDLFGIQLYPTTQVFVAATSIYLVMSVVARAGTIGVMEAVAFVVTIGAILLETIADRQLADHRSNVSADAVLNTGVWSVVRHPNYLGEILFWWGLWFFAIAAVPSAWWSIVGPLTMTALFVFISVPMMDRHLGERYTGYLEHKHSTAALVPRVF